MSWTQPVCMDCWRAENPGRDPVLMVTVEPERCCKCGADSLAGIYIRIDPKTVPFPRRKSD